MKTVQVGFVPLWLEQVLRGDSHDLGLILEPEKLFGILSKKDVEVYYYANEYLPKVLEYFGAPWASESIGTLANGIGYPDGMSLTVAPFQGVEDAIFGPGSFVKDRNTYTLEVATVGYDTILLKVVKENPNRPDWRDELARQFHARLGLQDFAATDFFRRYLAFCS